MSVEQTMRQMFNRMSFCECNKGSCKLLGELLGKRGTIPRLRHQVRLKCHTSVKTCQVLAVTNSANKTGLHQLPELGYRCERGALSRSRVVEVVGKLNTDALCLFSFGNSDEGIGTFRQFQTGYTIFKRC